MRVRHRVALVVACVLVASAVSLYWLPEIARRVAVARIHVLTQRRVTIEAVELGLLTGSVTVRGLRLDEAGEPAAFASFERLDVRLHLPSLLLGHVWIRELILSDSIVRVVRLPTGDFNFSDLIRSSGASTRVLDVTVDRFAVVRGTVTLEDRAVAEPRTWASEQIAIEARNLSTRRDDGSAVARSLTAGAPVSIDVSNLRLYPIQLQATVTIAGVDLTPLRVYFPPDAPIIVERGRASSTLAVTLDARDGLRADATGRLEDVVLVRPEGGEPLALVPTLTARVAGFGYREGDLRLAGLAVEGAMRVRDPAAPERYPLSRVRATAADLTWPPRTHGRLDLGTTIPGGGTLALDGTLVPPPAASNLHLRVAGLALAPWTRMLPVAGRITGLAEADLRMNEPLAAGMPARVHGSIVVNRFGLADGRRELLGAGRIEARGLEVHWPTRLVVERVLISGPRGIVERDRAGAFPLASIVAAPREAGPAPAAPTPPLAVEIREVAVRDGRMAWRDETVSPVADLVVSGVEAAVTGVAWPARGPLGVRAGLRPPGGGALRVTGRVALDPLAAELRVAARNAELAPYQPYLPTAARIIGAVDVDAAVSIPALAGRRASVRGSAGLARVEVRDGERTVARLEGATATGLELDWPERVAVGRLVLSRPWLLLERDGQGGLPLRTLLAPPSRTAVAGRPTDDADGAAAAAVTVGRLAVEDGGIRVVDHAVTPAFAVDLQPVTLRVEGLSTLPARPARLELTGRVGAGAELALRGTLGALGGPLRLDVTGAIREFAVPRANPYLLQQIGWRTREGRLTTTLECRIEGDALSARTAVRLSRLQLVRAAGRDEAQARIGLPLGLLTTLMKDRRGDINLSFPMGGHLSDPRFDFRETIWSAVRTVAVNAVTLPVSWIGRVRFSADSRIDGIQVDPLSFEPGAATLTPQGRERTARLVAFLDQLPEVRLALTPVVSSRDLEHLRRRALDAALERVAREARLSREDAAARMFAQHFSGRPAPDGPEATYAALLEAIPMPNTEGAELAAQRLTVVRATAKQAGIDVARLLDTSLIERPDGDGRIELEVVEPAAPRTSRGREILRKLGVLKGSDE